MHNFKASRALRPARRVAAGILGASLGIALASAPAAASVLMSGEPRLLPHFNASGSDYVARCAAGAPLRLKVRATDGDRVSVADRRARTGAFSASVTRRTGESFAVLTRSPSGATRRYHVRCLPHDFPTWTAERHRTPEARWYVTAPVKPPHGGYVAIFDSHGAPVWWRRSRSTHFMPWDAKVLDDGLIAWGHNFGEPFGLHTEDAYEARTLDGRRVHLLRTSGSPTDLHDLERLSNGHFLAITYKPRDDVDLSRYGGARHARVFDGVIQELTPSGRVVWRWSSRNHFSPSETGRAWWYHDDPSLPAGARGYDLLHVNSVEPDGDGLIVSARHLNAVFRIDRATGAVDWKLGGTFVAGKSLTVLGMPAADQVFGGQHDARVLPDGTISVFDNRARTEGTPAAVRFRIDPVARTATRIARVTEPDISKAQWGGSARVLPGGNWVVCWGGTKLITEQTPAGALRFALRLGQGRVSYRTQPLPPGRVTAGRLRRGMDRMAKRGRG
jgi:arylsulfotransferase ASST